MLKMFTLITGCRVAQHCVNLNGRLGLPCRPETPELIAVKPNTTDCSKTQYTWLHLLTLLHIHPQRALGKRMKYNVCAFWFMYFFRDSCIDHTSWWIFGFRGKNTTSGMMLRFDPYVKLTSRSSLNTCVHILVVTVRQGNVERCW